MTILEILLRPATVAFEDLGETIRRRLVLGFEAEDLGEEAIGILFRRRGPPTLGHGLLRLLQQAGNPFLLLRRLPTRLGLLAEGTQLGLLRRQPQAILRQPQGRGVLAPGQPIPGRLEQLAQGLGLPQPGLPVARIPGEDLGIGDEGIVVRR